MKSKGKQEGGLHPKPRSHGNVADTIALEESQTAQPISA